MNLDSSYVRLALSTLLGSLIGWERTLDFKPAGLRTYALVALGSATFVVTVAPDSAAVSRVVQGVVTGIGFLGAGSIVRGRGTIHGLTSAATIWLVAALGALSGAGRYGLAIFLTVLTLVVLRALRWIENRWRRAHGAGTHP